MHILILDRTPPPHVTLQSAHGLQGDQPRNWVFKTKRPFLKPKLGFSQVLINSASRFQIFNNFFQLYADVFPKVFGLELFNSSFIDFKSQFKQFNIH